MGAGLEGYRVVLRKETREKLEMWGGREGKLFSSSLVLSQLTEMIQQ